MDVYEGEETESSGFVKIFEAIAESASQSMLQLFFLTVTTWRKAWTETPVVVVSAAISVLSLSFQFATYPTTTGGRDSGFLFMMADEYRGRKVTTVGLLFYFASDIGLRALALSVFGYAADSQKVGITGTVDLVEIEGPIVIIRLGGRFWHKRSDVVQRVANYLIERIPEICDVEVEDVAQLDDADKLEKKPGW